MQAVDQLTGSKQSSNKTEAFISRRGSGMCFDFSPKDPTVYIVGTEDGNIHKCSCSYSEQYLQSYFGHSGPLYQIQWSPFAPGLFLSASADWTVKLWAEENPTALISFQVDNTPQLPHSHSAFAAVTHEPRVVETTRRRPPSAAGNKNVPYSRWTLESSGALGGVVDRCVQLVVSVLATVNALTRPSYPQPSKQSRACSGIASALDARSDPTHPHTQPNCYGARLTWTLITCLV